MKEQLVSFETAKLAKEKGFDVKTLNAWGDFKSTPKCREVSASELFQNEYYAPTQSLLQKWLREKYNCVIEIRYHSDHEIPFDLDQKLYWLCEIDYYGKHFDIELTGESDYIETFFVTYEEALEKGLQEALKLIII